MHSSFVVFYFVFVLCLFSDVSRGTVFFTGKWGMNIYFANILKKMSPF